MKKLFVAVFIIFVSVLGFALDLEQIDLNANILKEYADTINLTHGNYKNEYNVLYLNLNTEVLFFKNRDELTSADFNSEDDIKKKIDDRKYVKRYNSGTNDSVPMVKISKNWLIGTLGHLPIASYVQPTNMTQPEQDKYLLESFKNLDINKVVKISSSTLRANISNSLRGKKLDIDAKNIFTNKDLVLLYIPDEQLIPAINQKREMNIFVPNHNNTVIKKVFYEKGISPIEVIMRGNLLELVRFTAPQGEPIFLEEPINKGSLIGFCVDNTPQHNNGRVVQLFTQDRIDFIQKIISEVTPNEWKNIQGRIIFE